LLWLRIYSREHTRITENVTPGVTLRGYKGVTLITKVINDY